ncbi:hypothetical protein TK43_19720 [Roseovarius sp. JS7-11]|nr:hypothetical protein TK43_19720 [Roseovarius sp. JS7-11]
MRNRRTFQRFTARPAVRQNTRSSDKILVPKASIEIAKRADKKSIKFLQRNFVGSGGRHERWMGFNNLARYQPIVFHQEIRSGSTRNDIKMAIKTLGTEVLCTLLISSFQRG